MNQVPKALKFFGQHYLKDQNVIKTICDQDVATSDFTVEVGPGPATLTKALAEQSKKLFLLERDERFQEILEEIVSPENIFWGDALKFDWNQAITQLKLNGQKGRLISNLPYNVGTVLLRQFIEVKEIHWMTLMFQKEVADKIIISKNDMNSLGALINTYFETKLLIKVKPGAFAPPPKVDSLVIHLQKRDKPMLPFEQLNTYELFLRNIFQNKRKQLQSIIKTFYPHTNESILSELQINPQIRTETLTLDQIIQIFHKVVHV